MNILVLNCGSSSIKYKLYSITDKSVLARGGVERIGLNEAFVKVVLPNGERKKIMYDMPDYKEGVNSAFSLLTDLEIGAIKSSNEIDAVGHRIVQGGDLFEDSAIADKHVEDGIESLCDLVPIHDAGHLHDLRAVDTLMPTTLQMCVFDNALHSTMPDYAYFYAVPYELYKKYHVRRYGFHGTSHKYVSQRVREFLDKDIKDMCIITCHIGNGASVTAIKSDKYIGTSIRLIPLAGVVMGSRSGDIDSSAVTCLIEKLDKKPQEMVDFLNKESGVLDITGISSDMREIESTAEEGNEKALLALEMHNYRIKKCIGTYAAVIGGVGIIMWTAGIGGNQISTRLEACSGLELLGVKMGAEASKVRNKEAIIFAPDSKITVCVIPTDEETTIAHGTM